MLYVGECAALKRKKKAPTSGEVLLHFVLNDGEGGRGARAAAASAESFFSNLLITERTKTIKGNTDLFLIKFRPQHEIRE